MKSLKRSLPLPKVFEPFEVAITVESNEERRAILRALTWYWDNGNYSPYKEVIATLIPHFKDRE